MKKILFFYVLLIASALSVSAAEQPDSIPSPRAVFAWGADAGASIDLTGSDMSDINFSAYFGFSRGWINFLGIGAGADIPTSNSCRSYDLFAAFHTNFVNRPTLLFWPIRVGVSLNYLENNHQQTGVYGTTGLGINLARGRSYCSYMMIGYTFRQRRPIVGEITHDFKNLHYATVKIGISF